MNYWISVLFRIIPLAMGAICLGYAGTSGYGQRRHTYVAGHVVLFLSIICVALFTTAATIIRQLIHTYSTAFKVALPLIVCGRGHRHHRRLDLRPFRHRGRTFRRRACRFRPWLITCCVSTVALSSTKFILIRATPRRAGHHPIKRSAAAWSPFCSPSPSSAL